MFKKPGKTPDMMTFIFTESGEQEAKIRAGETVLETALRNKLPLDSSCTEGTCGSCRVTVVTASPELQGPEDVEIETKRERGFLPNERLACQMNACAGLKVKVPDYT